VTGPWRAMLRVDGHAPAVCATMVAWEAELNVMHVRVVHPEH
jgi:hypothetical protein